MNDEMSPESNAEEDSPVTDKTSRRQKRTRACQACRSMKIRCMPVEGQEACLSCFKVNRTCTMPGPARKRQKTVHKVAELEKKINALSEALIAKSKSDLTPSNTESTANDRTTEDRSEVAYNTTSPDRFDPFDRILSRRTLQSDRYNHELPVPTGPTESSVRYVDVIDRGILDIDTAEVMFNYWRSTMQPLLPVLALPDDLKVQDLRSTKPLLFLSLMTVASPAVCPSLNAELLTELNMQLASRILYYGEKSIEIAQAILIYIEVYHRTRQAKDLAFNQYIHSAVVMCLDLGMGKRAKKEFESDSVEAAMMRRTWLGCYKHASCVATLQRYPTLVRFTPYIEECLEYFSKSPYAVPSDKWLCCQVDSQRIAEEVSITFNMDDPASTVSFSDAKTQYHLKRFERQVEAWRETVPKSIDKRIVEHLASSLSLYIHEIAIHQDHNVDDFRIPALGRPNDLGGAPTSVTSALVEALMICVDSCHRMFECYLALDLRTTRSVANLLLVWNTYAGIALIKLHGLLRDPESDLGSTFNPELRIEYYLDAMDIKLEEVTSGGHSPSGEAFRYVFRKLKLWYLHLALPSAEENDRPSDFPAEEMARNIIQRLPPMSRTANPPTPATIKGQADLSAAYDASNYYNINWDEMNFSSDEFKMFDSYMHNTGWLNHLM